MGVVRRAVIGLACAAVLLPCLPARASTSSAPGAFAGAEQMAEADWMDLKARVFYFATGWRTVDPDGGLLTIGFVGKGVCQVMRDGNFTMIGCSGSARGHELATEDFNFDPAMAEASMTLRQGGRTHTVEWTGEGAPAWGLSAGGAGTSFSAGAGTARYAPAEGELFGKHLEPGRFSFGALVQDVGFGVFVENRTARYENGILTLKVTYKIPR